MNIFMKAITALGNIQRDRQLRPEPRKKKVRRGDGTFGEVLKKEEEKYGLQAGRGIDRRGGKEDQKH